MRRTAVAGLVALLLAAGVAACTSDVSGAGQPGGPGTPRATPSVNPSAAQTTASPQPSTPSQSPPPATVTVTNPAPGSPSATSSAPTPSPSASGSTSYTPPPRDTSGTVVRGSMGTVTGRSYCTSHSDTNGTAVMQWTSVNASKVYILSGPKASASTDAQADGGLQYPYNGSVTLHFDCSGDSDDFRFDAYNIEGHSGFVFTLHYNA